jgi:octaprenyl-diphosphate synthase
LSPTTLVADTARQRLAAMYAPIAAELADVERLLHEEMRSEFPYVDELVRYGAMLGGKRLRPALLLLTAQAAGEIRPAHITLAAVVEMIHTATLVHDDVLDHAQLRRHLATVNARWDDEASILLGDFLFSHAFYLTASVDAAACRVIGRGTNIVCEGELRQKGSRGNYELDEAEYFSIIDAKTAELTACSCQLGAMYAGASTAVVDACSGFGRDLGIAFQIADDLLDVEGTEQATGKSLGTDLEQLKPTLPLIYTLRQATAADRDELRELLAHEHPPADALQKFLVKYEALDYTRERAQFFATRAADRLNLLPASPAREVLQAMAEFSVQRNH